MDHGLILNPIVEGDHYVLGGYSGITSRPVLLSDGHGWGAYKPSPEYQARNGYDSNNCTNYGTNNALETLGKFHGFSDFPVDCSERYTGVLTGTTPFGNDPHQVIEIIRTTAGEIPESWLPFTTQSSYAEYYSPRPMLSDYIQIGKVILQKFTIQHEWVFNTTDWSDSKPTQLKEALRHGPVCVSVYAWKDRNGLYFKDDADRDGHWIQLLDYVDGKSWHVYDHYDQTEKDLEWHFNFFAAKVYYMSRNPAAVHQPTFGWYVWDILIDRVKRGFEKILGYELP